MLLVVCPQVPPHESCHVSRAVEEAWQIPEVDLLRFVHENTINGAALVLLWKIVGPFNAKRVQTLSELAVPLERAGGRVQPAQSLGHLLDSRRPQRAEVL